MLWFLMASFFTLFYSTLPFDLISSSLLLASVTTNSEVAQSCLTLCNPMDCSLPGSSVHGIFQARVLEWVAISFSKGSFLPRDRTQVSCIVGRHFYCLSHQGNHSYHLYYIHIYITRLYLL